MAIPNNIIRLRSPYLVNYKSTDLKAIFIDLWIWNGDFLSDKPVAATYSLYSTALTSSGVGSKVAQIDLTGYAEDYVEVNYTNNLDVNSVFMAWNLYSVDEGETEFTFRSSGDAVGLDGYSFYEDGINYDTLPEILSSTREYTLFNLTEEYQLDIPCITKNLQKVEYFDYFFEYGDIGLSGSPFYTETYNNTPTSTSDLITYAPTYAVGGETKMILFTYTSGNTYAIRIKQYKGLCDLEPLLMRFVNAFGAVESMYFLGNNTSSISTKRTSYTRSTLGFATYDIDKAQNTSLSVTGELNLTLNTGYVSDEVNPAMQEVMLSKNHWVSIPENLLGVPAYYRSNTAYVSPCFLSNTSLAFDTDRFTKLINYTVQFKSAVNRFNNNK